MKWPEQPSCHDLVQRIDESRWREINPDHADRPYRTCSYCGSIHPEDLIKLLESSTTKLGGADWKYGWPHKFYLQGGEPKIFGKWYNSHLEDQGYDDEAFTLLTAKIEQHAGIRFERRGSGLYYTSPCYDYQK